MVIPAPERDKREALCTKWVWKMDFLSGGMHPSSEVSRFKSEFKGGVGCRRAFCGAQQGVQDFTPLSASKEVGRAHCLTPTEYLFPVEHCPVRKCL